MLSVCVIVGLLELPLDTDAFTLAWTHSVEKIRWEEDYRLEGRTLLLESARIRGSGAGMEPPADAVFRDGAWHYAPTQRRFPNLVLANSKFGGTYEVCIDGRCQSLPNSPEGSTQPTLIVPCADH